MEIHVLGASGSEGPGHNPPAFLIDGFFLLDAGTVSISLDRRDQCRITHIFLTHAHLDHIKAIPFLVDNIVASNQGCQLVIMSGKDVISDLKHNVFNNRIWPDFSLLPGPESPVMTYRVISSREVIELENYRIYATRVDHAVPAYGYILENTNGDCLLYTGDTGPTERIWKRMREHRVKLLIAEASFPNEMEGLALASGHLTPSLLEKELRKMPYVPERIYITHLKPFYKSTIEDQLARIDGLPVHVLEDGMRLTV